MRPIAGLVALDYYNVALVIMRCPLLFDSLIRFGPNHLDNKFALSYPTATVS